MRVSPPQKSSSFLSCVLDFLYKRKILRLKPQYDDTFSVILRSERPKNLYCEAIASECELALRRSRLLFFLVGVHVILSFLIEKKRKNNGYEKRKTSDMLNSLVERC